MKLANTFISYFPAGIQNLIKWIMFPLFSGKTQPVFDVLIEKINNQNKRALLSYITVPFRLKNIDYQQIPFSNTGIARSIVRVLNKLGYIVDIVEYTDTRFTPEKKYDLFIGHGGFNFKLITKRLSSECPKIYFSAGPYWRYWNKQEKLRINALRKRRQTDYPYERLDVSEEWALRHSDAIIALGNKVVYESYRSFSNVYILNNAAYPDDHFQKIDKDYKQIRNNYLFFAGGGNVHKGLDLLLEAFKHTKAHLFVCQMISPKFYQIYKHELEDYPNIHLVGWTRLHSPEYYNIVDKCAFLVYPTCADGSPGAVVESMHQGLIPILSKEATIDTDDFGITLRNNSIKELQKTINYLADKPADWCKRMSVRTRKIATEKYSEAVFLQNLESIIRGIVEEHHKK